MFNFASKLINTIGDLVSVEDPPKSQPPQQPQSLQRRASGGDAHSFQQKPRFFGPGAIDYESTFRRGPTGTVSGSGPSARGPTPSAYRYPSGPTLTNYGPPSTSNYGPSTSSSGSSTTSGYGQSGSTYSSSSGSTFGSTTGIGSSGYGQPTNYGSSSGGYRSDRYEENTFKTPDIDYNEGKLMRNPRF